ncbi:hypothetical protein D910_04381 [Dendroctonus ponderosae]|uniref:28S ribosomal protein S25, mitochondrial n=1 Tax=Dendroctonus ponderosae TaxID=77166 RepID=U4U3S8_DENPD|nr:hypothetical protein D910_04381 [Dendroctonus ponderosae]
MPFMKGPAPIRRTIKYLEAGRLCLKDQLKILTVNYNIHGQSHQGASPFIRAFYDTGDHMLIDIDGRSKDEIYEHLIRVVGKDRETLMAENIAKEKKDNPANFGVGCDRHCICEIPGQIPCPGTCPLPNHMRGKFRRANKD